MSPSASLEVSGTSLRGGISELEAMLADNNGSECGTEREGGLRQCREHGLLYVGDTKTMTSSNTILCL